MKIYKIINLALTKNMVKLFINDDEIFKENGFNKIMIYKLFL